MLRLVRFFRRCDSCNSYNSVLLRTNDTVQRLCIRTVTNSCKQSINFNKVTDKIATNYSNGFNSDDSDSSSDSHSNSRNYWKKVVGCATIVMLSPLLLSAYYSSYDNNNDNISDNYNNSSFSHCDANSSSGDDPNYDKTAIDDIAKKRYSAIIVGGGTGGCITAYLTAKWLHHNRIPGRVLLIDRGVDYTPKKGPSPRIDQWFYNWGAFGEAHHTIREDGSDYPVTASDHKGVGGCGTHDTRITFQLREEHKAVVAEKMGWSNSQLDMYYQAALDMIPVARSIQTPELYYTKLIDAITSDDGDSTKKRNALLLNKGKDNEHRTSVVVDTIAETTLAMYNNAVRWTSAFLLRDGVRPNNLDVLAEHAVEKVTFAIDGDNLRATGVIVQHEETRKPTEILIERDGEVAVTAGAIGSVAVLQRSGVGPSEVLEPLGIKTIIDNNEVGHGVDHAEIAVMYEWLDKWNDPVTKQLPEGGVMGWPLVIFASFLPEDIFSKDETPTNNSDLKPFMAAHFGAGFAEPYTDFPSVVGTPSCVQPDQSAGYHAKIVSKDPFESLLVVHKDQAQDLVKMARGVCRMISIFEVLKAKGFVGERLEPSFPITIENRTRLLEWIKNNHYTVFHWALTCRSGKDGPVVDEFFRVRRSTAGSNAVVDNLRVGSAASLPDIPEANPHLSISAFSFALAESMVKTIAIRKKVNYTNPLELQNAANNVYKNMLDRKDDIVAIRRPGEETPKLGEVAEKHAIEWDLLHPDTEN